jgi:hypothetical protein
MGMESKWTSVVPTVPGHYWVSPVFQGKITDPRVKYLSASELSELTGIAPNILMFSDTKIPEPLWEKI